MRKLLIGRMLTKAHLRRWPSFTILTYNTSTLRSLTRACLVSGAFLNILIALTLSACREPAKWPTGYDLDRDGPVRAAPVDNNVGNTATTVSPSVNNTPSPGGASGSGGGNSASGGSSAGPSTGGSSTASGPSRTGGPTVSFLSFGDWGSGDESQRGVARAIGNYCASEACEFILTLGDNFYSAGVESTSDSQWMSKYRDVYASLGIPFYAVLGNHDDDGNIQAEIDYSNVDSSWHMPAQYYTFSWPADANPTGANPPLVQFFVFNSQYPYFQDATVQTWLSQQIAQSHATWKIVAMHHPVYSNGTHGDNEQGNNATLLPIICNKADLVLSGHDHDFAYLKSSQDGCPIEQLVIGTGGAGLRDVNTSDARAVSTGKIHGFGWFQASSSELIFRMIKDDGTVFYTTTWTKH